MNAWVAWDNDEATASFLKTIHPEQPVLLYNSETKQYKQYLIEVSDKSFTWLGAEMHITEGTRKI